MATNSISGDYGFVTQIPCILKEGNITVNSSAYGPFGKMTVCTFASEISKGDVVALSTDSANTADATENNIVVTALANNVDLAIGRIIDEPKWVRQPTASQSNWAGMLAAGYYRIATVELFIPMSIFKATLVCANASAITPGTTGKLDIDASASLELHGLSVVDVAENGSSDMIPLTYAAKSENATVSVLVGFKGFGTVTT
jgi:hypothetical protein